MNARVSENDGGSLFYRYDPAAVAWERLADLPERRKSAVLLPLGDSLFLVGGPHATLLSAERSVWVYDIPANQWHPGPTLPEFRGEHAAVAVDHRLVVLGGYTNNPYHLSGDLSGLDYADSVLIYNPADR